MLQAGDGRGGGDDDRDQSRGGRRLRDDRSEAEKLLDVGIRFEGLRALMDGLQKSGLRRELKPGCVVIARRDIPGDSIITSQSYELTSVYYQGERDAQIERVPVASLDARAPSGCEGYVKYVTLFSPEYHERPVIVRPEDAGLVSLRDEIVDSLAIGLPILGFWISVCAAFLAYGRLTGR